MIGWNDREIFLPAVQSKIGRPVGKTTYLLYLTVLMRIDRQSGNMRIDAQRKGDKVCAKRMRGKLDASLMLLTESQVGVYGFYPCKKRVMAAAAAAIAAGGMDDGTGIRGNRCSRIFTLVWKIPRQLWS